MITEKVCPACAKGKLFIAKDTKCGAGMQNMWVFYTLGSIQHIAPYFLERTGAQMKNRYETIQVEIKNFSIQTSH